MHRMRICLIGGIILLLVVIIVPSTYLNGRHKHTKLMYRIVAVIKH